MNVDQRDRSLLGLLETLDRLEEICRAGKTAAGADHDGRRFMLWQARLSSVRRARARVSAQLLEPLERGGLE